jgi:hypothetical protein
LGQWNEFLSPEVSRYTFQFKWFSIRSLKIGAKEN